MRSLRLPAKMGLLGAMLLPPLLLLLASGVMDARSGLATARAEQAGAVLVRQITELALQVHAHRTLGNRIAAGEAGLTVQQDALRARLHQAVTRLDATLQAGLPFEFADLWQPERERLLALATGRVPDPRADLPPDRRDAARAVHDERVEALRRLAFLIGERSELLFDPVSSTFFLMDLGVDRVLPWMEALGQLHAQSVELLGRDASAAERARMLDLAAAAERAGNEASMRLEALERSGVPAPGTAVAAFDAAERLVTLARKSFGAGEGPVEAALLHAAGAQALAAAGQLDEELWDQFNDLLAQRAQGLWQRMLLQCVASLAGLLGMAYLALSFYGSFSAALQIVMRSVLAVARGDLSQSVRIDGSDELAEVGSHLEGMSERLSTLVGEIRSSAVRVDQAGFTVAEDGRALSQRTEEQAGSLRQTVVTVHQLSAAVGTNAEAAAALQALTHGLREDAAAGHAVMAGTVQAMGTLEDSVRRVAEINAVIDDIAFQTNLLALNASVEAAHAGEAGKGFAVVASAIRQLASRTGEAAAEVRTLIQSTTDEASRSVHCIDEAGAHLASIVSGVAEVSQRLTLIADASAEQSRALVEVSASVGSLDDITQHNAALVAKSTGAAQMLADQAASLRASVASIQLRCGSADEARALVERALAYLAEVGWDRAVAAFNDPEGAFVDRDLRLFGLDSEGRYLVCGARPDYVGRSIYALSSLPAQVADALMQAGSAAAETGQGWMDYLGTDWMSDTLIRKSAYVHALNDGAFLACGVERRVVTAGPQTSAGDAVSQAGQSTASGAVIGPPVLV